jgi:hypothetical protein
MSDKSDRAKKAALTKARKKALQELANRKLMESTNGKYSWFQVDIDDHYY